jgi:PEP-CTERM motif
VRKYAGILWLIILCLAAAARPGAGQSITQVSTLTSTTTSEVLQLQAIVVPVPGTNRFDWSYRLTNPSGNSVRIDTFTVAPQTSLATVSSVRMPMGWYPARVDGPDGQLTWRLVPDQTPNPSRLAGPLLPGDTFLFEFELDRNGAPNAGSVSASGTALFAAASLGAGGPSGAPTAPGVIPEPGTVCLLGIGLGPFLLRLKRRPMPQ